MNANARIDGFSRWGEVHGLVALSLTPLMTCRGWSGLWRGVKNIRDPSREIGFICTHLLGGPGPLLQDAAKGTSYSSTMPAVFAYQ